MKKLAELNGDETFDFIYALSPILPVIADMEIIQAQLFQNYNERISKARAVKNLNITLLKSGGRPEKESEYKSIIEEADRTINAEATAIFARDISKLVPFLSSRANRGCVYEMLSVLEGVTVDEIKKYPAPKLLTKIKQVVSDTDFKSFLSYAEQSE